MFQKLSFKDLQIAHESDAQIFFGRVKGRVLRIPRVSAYMKHRYPKFFAYRYLRKNSQNPKSFMEKMWHRLAYDRRLMLTEFADKYAVREFVRERIGDLYLPKVLGVWQKGEKVPWEKLPREFVAKCTHGVGGSLIFTEAAPNKPMELPLKEDDWRLQLVNPNNLSRVVAEKYFNKWVCQRYDRYLPVFPSWSYRNIYPRVLFEELLTTSQGRIPNDYKLFCFDGKCKFIEVDIDRFGNYRRDFYTPQWERMDAHLTIPNALTPLPIPKNLAEMMEVAETLSKELDFVTIDLYDVDDRVVFGEISFYQGGGHESFSPQSMDEWVGSLWTLPSKSGKYLR